jgi:Ca2+/Na+ antiporter
VPGLTVLCLTFRRWGLSLLVVLCLFLFVGITILCDTYFVRTLQSVRIRYSIPEDVAGATLMGAGSSITELFTAVTDAFDTRNSIGFGTITGASIFNLLCNAGVAAVVVGSMQLDWQPFARDASFYAVAVLMLLYIVHDGKITSLESGLLVLGYVFYLAFMVWNRSLLRFLCGPKSTSDAAGETSTAPLLEDEEVELGGGGGGAAPGGDEVVNTPHCHCSLARLLFPAPAASLSLTTDLQGEAEDEPVFESLPPLERLIEWNYLGPYIVIMSIYSNYNYVHT